MNCRGCQSSVRSFLGSKAPEGATDAGLLHRICRPYRGLRLLLNAQPLAIGSSTVVPSGLNRFRFTSTIDSRNENRIDENCLLPQFRAAQAVARNEVLTFSEKCRIVWSNEIRFAGLLSIRSEFCPVERVFSHSCAKGMRVDFQQRCCSIFSFDLSARCNESCFNMSLHCGL